MPLDRPSARVIVIDGTGSVLLFRIEDPHDPKPPIWITPGGGVKPGEPLGEAAAASSLKRRAWSLIPQSWASLSPSARASGPFAASLCTPWTPFAWRTERFEPSTAGWEPLEHELPRGMAVVDDRRARHHERGRPAGPSRASCPRDEVAHPP